MRPLSFKISVSLSHNDVTYIRFLVFAYYILFPVLNSTNHCTLLQSDKDCRKGWWAAIFMQLNLSKTRVIMFL